MKIGKDGVIRLLTIDKDGNLIGNTKGRLHWHQMPVTDMCFSSNGVYLYSVGFETVCVRWNLESFAKNFISNAGYSIKFISCDETNNHIALTLHNNEIRLITSYFDTISKSLNNLNYYLNKEIETGLIYDPKHDAIVLNGRPGHLQFYSPLTEENMLLLDVARTRFVLQNKKDIKFDGCLVVNIEVFKIAISECGNWLVTYEMRDDKSVELETKLKFWRYIKSCYPMELAGMRVNEDYEVQTCINLPHKLKINEMKFSRNTDYMITTSEDGSFKIWVNNCDDYDWYCLFTYSFQVNLIPNHITISFDSSMFAINYGNLNTVWNSKDLIHVKYIDTLRQANSEIDKEDYLALEFGTGMMSHLLAGCTLHSLTIWDVSKSEIKWNHTILNEQEDANANEEDKKDLHFKQMVYNSSAKNLVLLDSTGRLDVFSINDGQLLFRLNVDTHLSKSIKFLLFINQSNYKFKQQQDSLFGDQMLCFMTINKKLFVLEHVQSKENRDKFKLIEDIIETTSNKKAISNFVQELIDRKANELKHYNVAKSLDSINFTDKCNLNKLVDEMFYNVPSHVLPPIQMIAKPFLRSLLNLANKNDEEDKSEVVLKKKQTSYNYNLDVEMLDNSDNEELVKNKIIVNSNDENHQQIDLFKNDRLAKTFVFKEDYSFLSK